MYPTFVIIRHTFFEAIVQPIYSLLIVLAGMTLTVYCVLPFFTLSEDHVMYKAVGLDVILLFVLIGTLFSTSQTIFSEIEDRTMLTLMSKPIRKWQVLVGKYLGIVASAGMAVGLLGLVLGVCLWLRIPGDNLWNTHSIDEKVLQKISDTRWMQVAGLAPALVLVWFQISLLAAIGVALSTRFSLVVNLPTVIFLYVAGNLTRFLFPFDAGASMGYKLFANGLATVLPYLEVFDLRKGTVYEKIAVNSFAQDPHSVPLGVIWMAVLGALAYTVAYAFFALVGGMWMFQNRELGGAEG